MEKRKKSALESGVSHPRRGGILVAVNALSALGVYARKDVTKTEKFTLSKGSGNLLRSMKQQLTIDAYVTQGPAQARRLRARSARPAAGVQERRRRASSTTRSSRPKDEDTKKKAKDAGPHRAALRRGERHRREGRRRRRASWASSSSTASSRTSSSSCRPTAPTASSSGSPTRSARFATRATTSTTRSASSPATTRSSRPTTTSCPASMGKFSMQGIITQNFPFYTFQDVDLKGGDAEISDDLDGLHHHAARQGPHREGAAPHRPVRDEGQVARGLRQRGERQGERRDDERAR